jgi:hypothetical protein
MVSGSIRLTCYLSGYGWYVLLAHGKTMEKRNSPQNQQIADVVPSFGLRMPSFQMWKKIEKFLIF